MKKIEIGQTIKIVCMKGEPQYTGKIGTVQHIDSIGQIHGTWGGLALQPEYDEWEALETK